MLRGSTAEIQRHTSHLPIDANRELKAGTVIQLQLMPAIGESMNQPTNAPGRMALQLNHLPLHRRFTMELHQGLEAVDTRLIRCNLSLQIRKKLGRVARRRRHLVTDGVQLIGVDAAIAHKQQIAQQQSFVVDAATERGHGSWRKTTDVGMVPAAGHEKTRLGFVAEHRSDGGDVGQMGSAMERIVAEPRISGL